uniref:Uncharacterized protein n=1 Tax=Globisporangium ultimum (strain ATCC 200006 / CBS 805.95 / DAOM BR144) TaxID=431595 RepID=K3XAI2_GLOUD
MNHRSCRFAALARGPSAQDAISASADQCNGSLSTDPGLRLQRKDLLVAMAADHVHMFARKLKNLSCSCRQDPQDRVLVSGFHCPHLVQYEDYCYFSAIPYRSIVQVLITYRTATSTSEAAANNTQGTAVAARTKDLILKFVDDTQLWLEFEHNLARGMFLEALTLSIQRSVSPDNLNEGSIDVEYIDLGEIAQVSINPVDLLKVFPAVQISSDTTSSSPVKSRSRSIRELFLSSESDDDERIAGFDFLRDALRHVVYDKVCLALQIARETSITGDPNCGFLLSTAKELSQALDEPDLSTFTWLSSAFINMHREDADKLELALSQVMYSIKIARENGFPYLLSLALHCVADLHIRQTDYVSAKEFLVEAARFMPEEVEPSMKMQLHRKIRELREYTATTKPSLTFQGTATKVANLHLNESGDEARAALSAPIKQYKISVKAQNAFNFWNHCMDESSRYSSAQSKLSHEAGITSAKDLLLEKVFKLTPSESLLFTKAVRSGSCMIEILESRSKAAVPFKVARMRVFFDSSQTFEWLRGEVVKRLRLCVSPASNEGFEKKAIESFRDPQVQQQMIEWKKQLGDALTSENQSLLAFMGDETTETAGRCSDVRNRSAQSMPLTSEQVEVPTITCSVCRSRIALDDIEAHSESCC